MEDRTKLIILGIVVSVICVIITGCNYISMLQDAARGH